MLIVKHFFFTANGFDLQIQTVRQLREIWCDLNLVKISFSNSSPLDPKKECDFAKLLYEFPGNINLLGSKDEY
ncbi:unnamed protein product [Rhizophagus irregularis]|nr:unnamed protein product [Rhizophagus irregularis]CAB4434068.1 unnamed protein product [Rhizophagus irregularis]